MKFSIKKIGTYIYRLLKNIRYKLLDSIDLLLGKSNPLIPPRTMIFIGDGDYKKVGDEFLLYFKNLGGLKPNDKVLDIGCGIGRMALPLTGYLSDSGAYYGFDIVKKGIDWCRENITPRFQNFHFEHSNIYNKMYNPEGSQQSGEFRFNFKDESFDFVFLTSVFTHMYLSDVDHYLSEISRVLKPGGKCLITFFLINELSQKLINNGNSSQELIFQLDENSFIKDEKTPEVAIGFNEVQIIKVFDTYCLKIIMPIHYGSWCGREEYLSYQDIVIAEKTS